MWYGIFHKFKSSKGQKEIGKCWHKLPFHIYPEVMKFLVEFSVDTQRKSVSNSYIKQSKIWYQWLARNNRFLRCLFKVLYCVSTGNLTGKEDIRRLLIASDFEKLVRNNFLLPSKIWKAS